MNRKLHALIAEDSEDDSRLLLRELKNGGYEVTWRRVETSDALRNALEEEPWDIVFCDFAFPHFSGDEALRIVKESGLDLPFIFVSGKMGEETAVKAMKAGAHDYVMKGNLARLAPAVEREMREAVNRAARRQAEESFRESELRNRRMWEKCPDAVLLVDIAGRILFANPAATRVFGKMHKEFAETDFFQLLPENLKNGLNDEIKRYLRSGDGAANWYAREVAGSRNESDLIMEISFSDIQLHGERMNIAFIRDVTARKLAERELRRNEQQFAVAREIQQSLFPKASPSIPGFDIAGASYPAEATGGDYYDFLPMLNGQWGIIVGDVTGHGLGPALLAAETRAFFRILTRSREDLVDIVARANLILAEDTSIERYVTITLARIDPRSNTLTYVNAGHPAGYVLSAAGDIKVRLHRTGVALGVFSGNQFSAAPSVQLASGDIVLLLTDGVEEAMSVDDTIFGAERALDCIRANRHLPACQMVERLYRTVRDFEHNTPQNDDVTLVVIKVL